VLSGLRSSGLVAVSDAQGRGRARALQLTPVGLRRLDGSHAAVAGVEAEMLQGISSAARRELAALLLRCAESLEAVPDG
jgi:DNA-binding MarR family transcriptional regulator